MQYGVSSVLIGNSYSNSVFKHVIKFEYQSQDASQPIYLILQYIEHYNEFSPGGKQVF